MEGNDSVNSSYSSTSGLKNKMQVVPEKRSARIRAVALARAKKAKEETCGSNSPIPPITNGIVTHSKVTGASLSGRQLRQKYPAFSSADSKESSVPVTSRKVSGSTSNSLGSSSVSVSSWSSTLPFSSFSSAGGGVKDPLLSSFSRRKHHKKTSMMKPMSTAQQLSQIREGRVDLESPESVLTQVNLKTLINRENFNGLPPLHQYKLIRLLPQVDQVVGPHGSLRLSSTALSNEYFTRACLDWTQRLSRGEFTPESQQRIRQEMWKEKSKLDPWKVRHFEPVWGMKSEDDAAESLGLCSPSTLLDTCGGLSSGTRPLLKKSRFTPVVTLSTSSSSSCSLESFKKPPNSSSTASGFSSSNPMSPLGLLKPSRLSASVTITPVASSESLSQPPAPKRMKLDAEKEEKGEMVLGAAQDSPKAFNKTSVTIIPLFSKKEEEDEEEKKEEVDEISGTVEAVKPPEPSKDVMEKESPEDKSEVPVEEADPVPQATREPSEGKTQEEKAVDHLEETVEREERCNAVENEENAEEELSKGDVEAPVTKEVIEKGTEPEVRTEEDVPSSAGDVEKTKSITEPEQSNSVDDEDAESSRVNEVEAANEPEGTTRLMDDSVLKEGPLLVGPESAVSSLIETGTTGSSLVDTETTAPSLAERETEVPSLVETETAAPSLAEKDTAAPSLVDRDTTAPSLVDRDTTAPSLVDRETAASSLVERVTAAPSLVDRVTAAPSLVDRVTAAPSLVDRVTATSSLIETKPVAPLVVDREATAPTLVETATAASSLVETEARVTQLVQTDVPLMEETKGPPSSPSLVPAPSSPEGGTSSDYEDFAGFPLSLDEHDVSSLPSVEEVVDQMIITHEHQTGTSVECADPRHNESNAAAVHEDNLSAIMLSSVAVTTDAEAQQPVTSSPTSTATAVVSHSLAPPSEAVAGLSTEVSSAEVVDSDLMLAEAEEFIQREEESMSLRGSGESTESSSLQPTPFSSAYPPSSGFYGVSSASTGSSSLCRPPPPSTAVSTPYRHQSPYVSHTPPPPYMVSPPPLSVPVVSSQPPPLPPRQKYLPMINPTSMATARALKLQEMPLRPGAGVRLGAASTPYAVRASFRSPSTKSRGRPQGSGGGKRTVREPKGEVNLERSYQICKAVIANSPNREALQSQLVPPNVIAKNGLSKSGSSGVAVVASTGTPGTTMAAGPQPGEASNAGLPSGSSSQKSPLKSYPSKRSGPSDKGVSPTSGAAVSLADQPSVFTTSAPLEGLAASLPFPRLGNTLHRVRQRPSDGPMVAFKAGVPPLNLGPTAYPPHLGRRPLIQVQRGHLPPGQYDVADGTGGNVLSAAPTPPRVSSAPPQAQPMPGPGVPSSVPSPGPMPMMTGVRKVSKVHPAAPHVMSAYSYRGTVSTPASPMTPSSPAGPPAPPLSHVQYPSAQQQPTDPSGDCNRCNLKAMVTCSKCGLFVHEDCLGMVGQPHYCVSCVQGAV